MDIIREAVQAFANPPGPTLPERQDEHLKAVCTLPWRMWDLNDPVGHRPRNEARSARYAALWGELQKHPDPFVRIVACEALVQMRFSEPLKQAETARLLLQTFVDDMPPNHPYRNDVTDTAPLRDLVQFALNPLADKDPEAALDYCRRILGPWITARNGVRVLAWHRIIPKRWLVSPNQPKEISAEADKLAGQIVDVLSTSHFSRVKQAEADAAAADLRQMRREYAARTGGAPQEGPGLWAQFEVKPIEETGMEGQVQRSVVDGRRLFCVAADFDGKAKAFNYAFGSWQLADGRPLHPPEKFTIPYRPGRFETMLPMMGDPSGWRLNEPVTSLACSGAKVYAGTPFGLLEYTPGGKVRLLTEADGLLSAEIWGMAWMDGKLYMGLGTSIESKFGFASYDPASGKSVLIASSAALEKKPPFDTQRPACRAILSDPKRKCLWLINVGGLWRYWPEKGNFEQAGACQWVAQEDVAWCGENIIASVPIVGLVLVDPDSLSQKWLMSNSNSHGLLPPPGVAGAPLISDFSIGQTLWPAWYDGEYLFTGGCLRAPNKTASSSKEFRAAIIGFHLTPEGLLAVTARGSAYLITRKPISH